MFFKTCGKYTTYFLIAKKYFSSALSFYFRYTYIIGSAKDKRRINTEKYNYLISKSTNYQIRKNYQKKFVFQRKVLSLYYDSEDHTNIKQKG